MVYKYCASQLWTLCLGLVFNPLISYVASRHLEGRGIMLLEGSLLRVRNNSKNIWCRLWIFGVWVGHVVEQFPFENRSGAVLGLVTRRPNVKTEKMQ
jgi:hypothetical protein